MQKVYIGDSVYLEIDSEGLTLTTENGYPDDLSSERLKWPTTKSGSKAED